MGENPLVSRLQRWLQYAPAPPERGGNSYDVFISYRSSDRSWAMALYDALKLAGWEPFLDQYELVQGADLQSSLEDALLASSSGVILWSSHTGDSAWCKRERNSMRSLKDRNGRFNYVFAQLDTEPLPLFAQSDLYLDFSDSPEGPRGEKLLRLICGLRGVALAPEAVSLAQQVDRTVKEALIAIQAAVEAENSARLHQLGMSEEPDMLASPAPLLAAAQGLIGLGLNEQALDVLRHARTHFPLSIRGRQLEGLALRRLQQYQAAIEVVSELRAAGHQDAETLGILAAAWDGRYRETGKKLHLRHSRELYRSAFLGDSSDYYTGINAAAKSLFLGEAEEAARLADLVAPLVAPARDGADFWAACTLGEVYLLRGEPDAAAEQYQRVIDRHPAQAGDLAGTRQQAERICAALELSAETTDRVLAPFRLLLE